MEEVQYSRTESLRIETEKPLDVYADGEYVCQTPIEVKRGGAGAARDHSVIAYRRPAMVLAMFSAASTLTLATRMSM